MKFTIIEASDARNKMFHVWQIGHHYLLSVEPLAECEKNVVNIRPNQLPPSIKIVIYILIIILMQPNTQRLK
jgi:hypothetical protein